MSVTELTNLPADKEKMSAVCKGCGREFKKIQYHLAKSKACISLYDSYTMKLNIKKEIGVVQNKKIMIRSNKNSMPPNGDEGMPLNDNYVDKCKPHPNGANLIDCKGCGKSFSRIRSHLQKSPTCRPFNDLEIIETDVKEKRKEYNRICMKKTGKLYHLVKKEKLGKLTGHSK